MELAVASLVSLYMSLLSVWDMRKRGKILKSDVPVGIITFHFLFFLLLAPMFVLNWKVALIASWIVVTVATVGVFARW